MPKTKQFNLKSLYFPEYIAEAMKGFLDYSFTLVEAPMGYGKTTFVRESLKNMDVSILWQKVHDNSISGFWKGFCRQLGEIDSESALSLEALGLPNDSTTRFEALSLLEGIKLPKDIVLVIDDYHFVAGPETNDFIEFLINSEIPYLHMVLVARYTGLQGLEEFKLKGLLLHITKEDFEFSNKDIKAYYNLCGIVIKEDESQMLYALTEGWISALYLIMLNYQENEKLDTSKDISKLLENAVYRHFSEEIKELLISLCIFEGFDIEQAVYMSKNENANLLLEEVISKNAFVKYDSVRNTYQMHNIFTNFLLEELEKKNMQKNIYLRAAHWFQQIGEYKEAMHYFYLCQEFEQLLIAMEEEKIKFKDKYFENDLEVLIKYLEEAPANVKAKHHMALLMYTLQLLNYNKRELFGKTCSELLQNIYSDQSISQVKRNQYLGEFEIIMMFTKYNNINKMMEQVLKAHDLLNEPSILFDKKSVKTAFGSPSVLYLFYSETGKLEEHVKELLEAFPCYQKVTSGSGNGQEFIMESEWYFNIGDFENAEISVYKAINAAENFSQTHILICAMFLQLRIALVKGEFANIVELFKQMQEKIEHKRTYFLMHTIELCEGYIFSLLNKMDKIPDWIINGEFKSKQFMPQIAGELNIIYGRVLLIKGEYHKLIGSLDNFIEIASIFPNLLGQIYTYIYVAAPNRRMLRQSEAVLLLKKALELAIPDKLYMPFVENGDYIKPLLEELHQEGCYCGDIKWILTLYENYQTAVERMEKEYGNDSRPKLSQREMEIARLAVDGVTNKEIGETLFVSPNTVKMAIKSIYTKLSINNRTLLKQYLETQHE